MIVSEWVAVYADDSRCGRGAHMCEKKVRVDMPAEMAQIAVRPGRPYFVIETRLGMFAVPAKAKAVTIRTGRRLKRIRLCVTSECEGSVT